MIRAATAEASGPARLPLGFRVLLDPDVRRLDNGRVLIGGSPVGIARLSARAAAMFTHDAGGTFLDLGDEASAALAERLLARNLARPDLAGLPEIDPRDLTVVIPVRDRTTQLGRCLRALQPLACVVIDDGSHRPEAVAAVASEHGADYLALPTNCGPAAARNAGLAAVRTRYVVFVDSDVVAQADGLLALCRHFADPSVAVVGPRVSGIIRARRVRWFQRYDAAYSSLDQGLTPATVAHGATVSWLPSACLVARTDTLRNGFDVQLRVGEDVDLVWRLLETGHRVRYAPEVVVTHDVRADLRTWLGRIVAYGTSGAVLAERHGDAVAPAAFSALHGLTGFAVLSRSRAAFPLAGVAAAVTYRRMRPALPDGDEGNLETLRLTGFGLVSAVRQAGALTSRHWWPLAAAGLLTRRGRRLVAGALVLDAATAAVDRRRGTTFLERLAGRRLHDLAYGAGLWRGALGARSIRCLLPRRLRAPDNRRSRRPSGPFSNR